MKLHLKNVGKIKDATIAIDGITVIAGENNTGKSTVSRAAFSILNSFSNVDERIKEEMEGSLKSALTRVYRTRPTALWYNAVFEIMEHMDEYKESPELIREYITESVKGTHTLQSVSLDRTITRVLECLNVSREEIFHAYLEKDLNAEFNGQIQNIYTKEASTIELRLEDKVIFVNIQDGHISNSDLIELSTSAVYLDSPMILDDGRTYRSYFYYGMNHQEHLRNCLFSDKKRSTLVEEIVASKKLNRIYDIISKVCNGDFIKKMVSLAIEKKSVEISYTPAISSLD